MRLWDALVPLRSINAFMQTGAHPDDETSPLLARLSKGDGVRVAYACAVRGEGGQNVIGTELDNAMGVLRTREMEHAVRVLGAELYWLNEDYDGAIFDFGFSKSPVETFERWGRERTVERIVRAIRTFRPEVIAPTFLDVGGPHGHHRAVTVATGEAFTLAADPTAFPEQIAKGLRPWQVKKLYLPAWSGGGGSYDDEAPPPNATITVDVGGYDPVYGATYAQIGQWSRACHRSQGMGRWVREKPESIPLHRLACVLDVPVDEAGLFDGLPRTLRDLAEGVADAALAADLRTAQDAIDAAIAAYPENTAVARAVHRALGAVRTAIAGADGADDTDLQDVGFRLAIKQRQLCRASIAACLVVARLDADAFELTPGSSAVLRLTAYVGGPLALANVVSSLVVPDGWTIAGDGGRARDLAPGETQEATFEVAVPADAAPAFPYRFAVDPAAGVDVVVGRLAYTCDGVTVETAVEPEQPIAVLPALSLDVAPAGVVHRLGDDRPIAVTVTATSHVERPLAATLTLAGGTGGAWRCEPAGADLALAGAGDAAGTTFQLLPADTVAPGKTVLRATATGVATWDQSVRKIEYPHIRVTTMVRPAEVAVLALDIEVPRVRVGYVGGGSDRVHLWLRQLGVTTEPLDAAALQGDLGQYDTIVVGIFAYGRRPDLLAANHRLKDFVTRGGNLVTLYQRPWDNWDPESVPPRLLKIGQPSLRWRVTDPAAAVTHLAPDHPVLNTPNRITEADWRDWAKERGLYFAAAWDDAYVPLVAMADPGEAPHEGALLAARVGDGQHIHTGLILHYQMDFLVPGAFRLFANMIAPPA